MRKMRYIDYECGKCGALDSVALYETEPVPVTINCFKCHAGLNKSIEDMCALRAGMFPVKKAA